MVQLLCWFQQNDVNLSLSKHSSLHPNFNISRIVVASLRGLVQEGETINLSSVGSH